MALAELACAVKWILAFAEQVAESCCCGLVQAGTEDAALGCEVSTVVDCGKEAMYSKMGDKTTEPFNSAATAFAFSVLSLDLAIAK